MLRARTCLRVVVALLCPGPVGFADRSAQGLGGAGTVQGTVKDPTGGVMQAVAGEDHAIRSPASREPRPPTRRAGTSSATCRRTRITSPSTAQGFQTLERDVDVRTGVPITMDLTLALAGATTAVEVVGHAEDLLERDPTAHTDIDQTPDREAADRDVRPAG